VAVEPGTWQIPSRSGRRQLGTDIGYFLRQLDYVLLASAAGIVAYGLWVISAVTRDDVPGDSDFFLVRQAIYVAIGVVGLAVVAVVNPDVWRRHRVLLYGVLLALTVAVFAVGPSVRGSRRWIDLGFFRLQPSELGKIVLVLFIAGFLADRSRRIGESGPVSGAIALAALPILLVFIEPDFGTALVLSVAVVAALFFAGVRWPYLAALGIVGAGVGVAILWALPSAGYQVLKPYQVDRLVGFLNPDADPSGTTYNIIQSITAVGSGGLDGRGIVGATQTKLNYLPEHATDFIFASLAEQRGFLGASILLLLYALIVWRGIKIIAIADSLFSATVAGAVVAAFLFQVVLNIGMTIGIAPITGIPLPFVSYGGSSMITSLAMIGLLEAIHIRGRMAQGR
jgi:rod shape determining protein RodA